MHGFAKATLRTAKKDAITQKPFYRLCGFVGGALLQIQHTPRNEALTILKKA